jgi:hypothetical protein
MLKHHFDRCFRERRTAIAADKKEPALLRVLRRPSQPMPWQKVSRIANVANCLRRLVDEAFRLSLEVMSGVGHGGRVAQTRSNHHVSRSSTRPTCTADHWPFPLAVGMDRAVRAAARPRRLATPAVRSSAITGARSCARELACSTRTARPAKGD